MAIPIRVGPDFAAQYPDASTSATECAMNLASTGDLLLARVAATLQPLDVTPAGGLVLGILEDAGAPCPPNYISERLIVSRATVTGVLDTLAKRGLVHREPHPLAYLQNRPLRQLSAAGLCTSTKIWGRRR